MGIEPLHAHAEHNLRFIREKMEHAAPFTAVPGWGGVLMGAIGLGAAVVAAMQPSQERWLAVWVGAAIVALLVGGWAMDRKTRALGTQLLAGKGRKFILSLSPPLLAGGVLTWVLFQGGLFDAIPGIWLLMYGTAAVTGGAFSSRVVPLMGVCFMILGVVTLLLPAAWGNWLLAIGFGGMQVVFGLIIVRKYGG
jgi:hypothetical protein